MLGKGMFQVEGGMELDFITLTRMVQNLKTPQLFLSGIFHLIFWATVETETIERETMDKGETAKLWPFRYKNLNLNHSFYLPSSSQYSCIYPGLLEATKPLSGHLLI